MNRIRIGRPRAGSERPWPGLSRRTRETGTSPGLRRSRGPRVPERRPGHDDPGRPAPMAGGPDGDPRGQDGPPRTGVHVGMHPAHQRGGAADRSRTAALGSVAGRVPARRQPSTAPRPERNGAVTPAGGRGPRSRPRHRQRVLPGHPGPPDRHQQRREPSRMCSAPRRSAKRPVLAPSGKNTRTRHRQPASPGCTPAAGRAPWSRRGTSTAGHLHPPPRRRRKNSGGGAPLARQQRGPARRCAATCSSPARAAFAATPAARPARRCLTLVTNADVPWTTPYPTARSMNSPGGSLLRGRHPSGCRQRTQPVVASSDYHTM